MFPDDLATLEDLGKGVAAVAVVYFLGWRTGLGVVSLARSGVEILASLVDLSDRHQKNGLEHERLRIDLEDLRYRDAPR